MKSLALPAFFLAAHVATADVMPFNYHLGHVEVSESENQIVIHAMTPLKVAILPGGKTWPLFSLDEARRIYAGNTVIDAGSGKSMTHANATLVLPYDVSIGISGNGFRFQLGEKSCSMSLEQLGLKRDRTALTALQNRNISFSSRKGSLLALAMHFNVEGDVAGYTIEKIDIYRCKSAFREKIGNPDLLIELANSEQGGWWITGSIEQTLLQSEDGQKWRKTPLPSNLSSLVSAFVVNKNEIWLAGIMGTENESPYLLVYSSDGGQNWRNVIANDRALSRLPAGWLEGQKRRVQQ